jgi:alginate O-acetyltransferase complex protein AlgI
MVFSSPVFLFGFLPLMLFLYYCSPRKIKNIELLCASLVFYAWGEVLYAGVIIVSIIHNYFWGLLIQREQNKTSKFFLVLGIITNLVLLTIFKYANFIVENLNAITSLVELKPIQLGTVHLPLGISFFTFQAISYLVDVYRREVPYQKNIIDLALYISLFPQLIAGPIVRYHDIATQITNRVHSTRLFAKGAERFILGFAKKMLIANPLGEIADSVFSFSTGELTAAIAWIGALTYALQIYFDFSGYSDMAIGLGRMFGFKFLENFNYPYISTSVREFWRRWHISLSSWFKDYVYIPLGGSRATAIRVFINLLIVFILTGFWHGASWNFLVWGLFHGVFLAGEHAGFSNVLRKAWRPFQHLYLIFVVVIGWVFFRADSISHAIHYLYAMVNVSGTHTTSFQFAQILSHEAVCVFIIGSILSTNVCPLMVKHLLRVVPAKSHCIDFLGDTLRIATLSSLLLLSIMRIASSTFNPFIYYRF